VVSAGTDGTAADGIDVTEENDRGLCFHVEYHDFDLATCGDINGTDTGSRTNVESPVAGVIGDVEVAKVNHHGSSYSSNTTYVSTLSAEVAIISVGKNSFGHPDAAVISRWQTYGEVFQTQSPTDNALIDGDIIITTTGVTNYTTTAAASSRSISRPMDETTP
jgi:beta-lactamase superfamily II metal-dependent hydrolase